MKSHCRCPSPPGGSVSCDAHQIAYCKVSGGEVSTGCLTPPADAHIEYSYERRLHSVLWWTLNEIGFDTSRGVVERSSRRDVFKERHLDTLWFRRLGAGETLQLEGWALLEGRGEFVESKVTIRMPMGFDDPLSMHRYTAEPA